MKKTQKILNLMIINTFICFPINTLAMEKSETIYTHLNNDGSPYKTVVSNHLSWVKDETLEDDSELKEILNISGEETFSKNQNQLSWNALGKDIFYEGKTEKELPIKTEIKYYLNEEEKNPNEIIGKNGNIKIEFTFKNQKENLIKINGQNKTIFTPFVTTIGTVINGESNKNFSINNGKIINTGSKNMIIGLASPGLYESIGLNDLKELNKITITYETTNFSLNNIYIVSTPKLLNQNDLTIFNKMDLLSNNMKTLETNMNKLENGAKSLEDGTKSLVYGTSELTKGITAAKNGITNLKTGANSLEKGLNQIIISLNEVKKELTKNNLEQSLQELNTLKKQNNTTKINLVNKTGLTEEQIKNVYTTNNLKNYTGTDTNLLNIKNTTELIMLLEANNKAIDSTITTLTNLNNKLNNLLNTLESTLQTAHNGSIQLNNGLEELNNGINNLYNGSINLNNGATKLQEGAKTLSIGSNELNKNGIKKLVNYTNTIKNYTDTLEALQDLSKNYNGFTSKNSNNTTFISVTKSTKITYTK